MYSNGMMIFFEGQRLTNFSFNELKTFETLNLQIFGNRCLSMAIDNHFWQSRKKNKLNLTM